MGLCAWSEEERKRLSRARVDVLYQDTGRRHSGVEEGKQKEAVPTGNPSLDPRYPGQDDSTRPVGIFPTCALRFSKMSVYEANSVFPLFSFLFFFPFFSLHPEGSRHRQRRWTIDQPVSGVGLGLQAGDLINRSWQESLAFVDVQKKHFVVVQCRGSSLLREP